MLKNNKISQYKIKKILKHFIEDYSSTETSKIIKLNRKTVDRYYKIFRQILLRLFMELLQTLPLSSEYLGCIEGDYEPKCFFNIHKINEKVFLTRNLTNKLVKEKYIVQDNDFYNFARFAYLRLSKFHGLTKQGYYYQGCESVVRYNYTQQDLFDYTWQRLIKYKK